MKSAREARQAWIRALEAVGRMRREPELTLPVLVETLGREHADRPALLGADEAVDFAGLADGMSRVARWAAARCPGQTVGLLLPNRPAMVVLWLGLTRAGCVAALLNPSLTGSALAHAVAAGRCALVIADDDLLSGLDAETPVLSLSTFWAEVPTVAGDAPPPPHPDTTALLVFTSGTTGLPKAARVSHGRVLEWALWFGAMLDLAPDDRIYDCLPLYHSTGGVVAIGAALSRGASVLVAQGFRASTFWDDVTNGGCTVFFYIGELCRYLLHAPPQGRAHRLRLACGNGLQASVWEPFQSRSGIPDILEFYAATEGSISLYNCEGQPGAIGRVPPFLQQRFPFALIRLDEEGRPMRGPDGRCLLAPIGQAGEAIGRIDDRAVDPARRFEGYTDTAASATKVIEDVFKPGDRWFRSGDLMRIDTAGFVFFIDRLGDTFRWKGENVSTTEVAAVLRDCPGVDDATVYGVQVPGHEGKAGMAAIAGPNLDPSALWSHVLARLPGYARPVFIRRRPALALTGTFKLSNAALAAEGFTGLAEPVWVADRAASRYVLLDAPIEAAIGNGDFRL